MFLVRKRGEADAVARELAGIGRGVHGFRMVQITDFGRGVHHENWTADGARSAGFSGDLAGCQSVPASATRGAEHCAHQDIQLPRHGSSMGTSCPTAG